MFKLVQLPYSKLTYILEDRVQEVQQLINNAKNAGIKFVLLLSLIESESRSTTLEKQFSKIENIVKASGIPCCFLRTNMYMENILWQVEEIASNGTLLLPLGNGQLNLVALQDVANAISQMYVLLLVKSNQSILGFLLQNVWSTRHSI